MAKNKKYSRKLQSSLDKINEVFDKMKERGICVKEDKNQNSNNSNKSYKQQLTGFMKDVNEMYGISNIRKVTPEIVDDYIEKKITNYHQGHLSEGWNMHSLASAMKAFNLGVQKTRVFKEKHKFQLGEKEYNEVKISDDPGRIREKMKANYVFRHSAASTVLKGTPDTCQAFLDNVKNQGYNTENRRMAFTVAKLANETGGRISALIKLKPKDFTKKNGQFFVTFEKDKGGKTTTVPISRETYKYARSHCEGKKANQRIFSTTNRKGQFKSVDTMRKEFNRIYQKAGKEFTITEMVKIKNREGKPTSVPVTKTFSAHSLRKGFAIERTHNYYQQMSSKEEIEKMVAERSAIDPKFAEKLQVARDRINKYRSKGNERDLTREEYALFFTSCDLSHYRLDVIRMYYCNFDDVRETFPEYYKKS